MGALDYDSQIEELVTKKRFDEAISLLNMLEDTLLKDKEGQIREIKMLKAQGLFAQQKYRAALDLFTEASAPPERVIALYPKSIAGELSSITTPETSETELETVGEETPTKAKLEKVLSGSAKRGLLNRTSTFAKGVDISDTASVRSMRMDSDNMSIRRRPTALNKPVDKPLEGDDLIQAVTALCSFLAHTRVQIQKYINTDGTLKEPLPDNGQTTGGEKPPFGNLIMPSAITEQTDWQAELEKVAKLVDTTLFRAYMLARPGLAGPLFRLDNFCDPHVVEEKLYESGRYGDLIDFLHGKKLHREALEMLEKFGRDQAEGHVKPELRGPGRTVGYLQQLPPEMIDIILEFAKWPIRAQPDVGMQVFLADTENAETLPRDRVLEFLVSIDEMLAVRYLEHVLNELNDQTPEFHQRLVDLYLEKLKAHRFDNEDERVEWRRRLESFMRKSAHYNKGRTFRQLPTDDPDFFEARAIVLSAMGNHKQALQIYVFQLVDYAKAEEYCNRVYLSSNITSTSSFPSSQTSNTISPSTTLERPFIPFDPEESAQPNIYTILLSLYLRPPPPHQPAWPPALDLLSKHGARLPASSTLDLIPADLAIHDLQSYFLGRIRNATSVLRQERIIRGLEGVRKVRAEGEVAVGSLDPAGGRGEGGRARKVVIREEDHCKVCHKRFGGSAVRVYPDGEVVHYGCFQRGVMERKRTGELAGVRRGVWV
ncbi:Vacuolar morphogenesis protein 6 [Elasticomyces elasticus]|nr:Vacuolar morphogenesis protein 6 [Elasticomyces elasticus]